MPQCDGDARYTLFGAAKYAAVRRGECLGDNAEAAERRGLRLALATDAATMRARPTATCPASRATG